MIFKEEQIIDRYRIVQERYRFLKKEILVLKEENRILKIKVENSQVEFEDDGKGGLTLRRKMKKKFMPKDENVIGSSLFNDPVLINLKQVPISETTDYFIKKIEHHEKDENIQFQIDDFQDRYTSMPQIIFANADTNTDVIDLCGDSIGMKKRKTRNQKVSESTASSPEPVRSALENLENIFINLENEEDDVLVIIGNDDKNQATEMKRKHNHIKRLINGLRESVYGEMSYENMPHSKVLNLIYNSLNQVLKFLIKHPLEKVKDFQDEDINEDENSPLRKKIKLIQTVVPNEDEIKTLKAVTNDALAIIGKVISTPIHKLKNVMFKKNVLKLITHFYEERAVENELVKGEHFGVYVFDVLVRKFIMKKAAENRFNHLLASCMKYKTIQRIRLFGRFIGLYDQLDSEDLNFYLECFSFLNNSLSGKTVINLESNENHVIPYIRCIECIKHFEKLLPKNGMNVLKENLEKNKRFDKSNKFGVVDTEDFLENIVATFHSYKLEHMNFMRCIYEASDLNEDGYLQYQEFQLLLRYLSVLDYSPQIAKQLFDAYSETFTSEDEMDVKAISFVNLCQMNAKHQIFTFSSMVRLSQVSSPAEAEDKIREIRPNIDYYINDIYWRFTESPDFEEHLEEMHHLVEILRFKLSNNENPEGTWLAYRLLDEESKRIMIAEKIKEVIPVIGLVFYEKRT